MSASNLSPPRWRGGVDHSGGVSQGTPRSKIFRRVPGRCCLMAIDGLRRHNAGHGDPRIGRIDTFTSGRTVCQTNNVEGKRQRSALLED